MSAAGSGRPDDDLDRAYARSHALADDGRGPSASVRANVLAAAREVAAQARPAAADGATPPLTPVAPPVAAVGRGRVMAVNLSSWRVRSGAAFCAALLVALGAWRFEAGHRVDGGVQVATAALELAAPPATTLRRELPVPQPEARPAGPSVAPPAREAAEVATPARPAPAPGAPPAPAPTTVTITAAAPPQPATMAPKLPSVLPRRVALVPPPRSASAAGLVVEQASADARRHDIARAGASDAEAAPAGLDAGPASPLQSAADRGDVESLKALLAEPAARVDAPDAAGRTALLHAVLAQQVAAVRLLVAAGADPARADRAGLTPRAAAQAGASAEIAALLAGSR